MNNKKVGVALSGGAARALSHIGVLKVLEEIGVEVKAISGTSMGAIIGAFYSSGISLKEMEAYVSSMDWRSFLLFSDITLSRTGMINGKRVEEILDEFLEDKTFADCSREFCCVATDIISNRRVILNTGKLKEAVRASISIPGFFAPVYRDNMILVDGGIIEPLPTRAIRTLHADYVVASSISFDNSGLKMDNKEGHNNLSKNRRRNVNKLSAKKILGVSFNIMQREMSLQYIKYADIAIEPVVVDYSSFDLTNGKELIARGEKAAYSKIPELKTALGI